MKAVQYFSSEYLKHSSKLRHKEILQFLEEFRLMHAGNERTKLISIKVPERLLNTFRQGCRLQNIPYQTQIKVLMREWLESAQLLK